MNPNLKIKNIPYEGKTYDIGIEVDPLAAIVIATAKDHEGFGPSTTMYYVHGKDVSVKDGKLIIGEKVFSPEFQGEKGLKKLYFIKEQNLEDSINKFNN